MRNHFITSVLILTHLILAWPLRLIFKIKYNSFPQINDSNSYIIAANHISKLDPYLILASIPFMQYVKLLPIRFPIYEKYMRHWYQRIFFVPWGCISTKKTQKRKPLPLLLNALKKGETIFIFPSAGIEKNGKKMKPKVGVIYLEKEIKKALILPVKINLNKKLSFMNILRKKIKTQVLFKNAFRHSIFPNDFQPLADNLMRRIRNNFQLFI